MPTQVLTVPYWFESDLACRTETMFRSKAQVTVRTASKKKMSLVAHSKIDGPVYFHDGAFYIEVMRGEQQATVSDALLDARHGTPSTSVFHKGQELVFLFKSPYAAADADELGMDTDMSPAARRQLQRLHERADELLIAACLLFERIPEPAYHVYQSDQAGTIVTAAPKDGVGTLIATYPLTAGEQLADDLRGLCKDKADHEICQLHMASVICRIHDAAPFARKVDRQRDWAASVTVTCSGEAFQF